jgi:purine-binding chemotaxis protein CheW
VAERNPAATPATAKVGKYLTFGLAAEQYAVEIDQVREIIGMMDITRVPRTPAFLNGIINLRGRVVPVMDLRVKFGMPTAARSAENCIIVVHAGDLEMGIIVDRMLDVIDVSTNDIKAPSFGAGIDTAFIQGIAMAAGRVVILLEVSRILTGEEAACLAGV